MKFDTLIVGSDVVLEDGIARLDIGIASGKVVALTDGSHRCDADQIIDGTGKVSLPGAIDPHVHLGYTGSFEEQCRADTHAAVVGGVTAMNIFTQVNSEERFRDISDTASQVSLIDYKFTPTLRTEEDFSIVDKALNEWGIDSFKFYMSYRAKEGPALIPGWPVNSMNDGLMYDLMCKFGSMQRAGKRVLACVHAENWEMVEWYTAQVMNSGRDGLCAWAEASPGVAEAENVLRASYFAEKAGCPLYLVHLSAQESYEAVRRNKDLGVDVKAETCPQYLLLTCDSGVGNLGKISPPIRYSEDVDACWRGLADGTYDTVGTDNSGTILGNKSGSIWDTARGFPGLGTLLPAILSEGVNKGRISIVEAARITSTNAAKIFNIYPRKGRIGIGSDADIVLVDIDMEKIVAPEVLGHYSDYNVFGNRPLRGWPAMTLVGGDVVYAEGEVVAEPGRARYLRHAW